MIILGVVEEIPFRKLFLQQIDHKNLSKEREVGLKAHEDFVS
jgi:hypothetical protein